MPPLPASLLLAASLSGGWAFGGFAADPPPPIAAVVVPATPAVAPAEKPCKCGAACPCDCGCSGEKAKATKPEAARPAESPGWSYRVWIPNQGRYGMGRIVDGYFVAGYLDRPDQFDSGPPPLMTAPPAPPVSAPPPAVRASVYGTAVWLPGRPTSCRIVNGVRVCQ